MNFFFKIFFLKLLAGAAAGKEAATATQCLTDTFSVTNPRFGIFLLKYYALYRYFYIFCDYHDFIFWFTVELPLPQFVEITLENTVRLPSNF